MPGNRVLRVLLIAVMAAGLAASAGLLVAEGRLTGPASTVSTAVYLRQVEVESRSRGADPATVLAQLTGAGVTAVVLEERTIADLVSLGGLRLHSDVDALAALSSGETARLDVAYPGLAGWRAAEADVALTVLTGDRRLVAWAYDRARLRFGTERAVVLEGVLPALAIRGDLTPETRLGFYPPDLALARELGLRLIVRLHYPSAPPGLSLSPVLEPLWAAGTAAGTAGTAAGTAADTADADSPPAPAARESVDVEGLLFDGGWVWGYGRPEVIAQAAAECRRLGLAVITEPGAVPLGLDTFGPAVDWRVIKMQTVWSLGKPELFAEGVIERGAPLLVLMPGVWSRCGTDPEWPDDLVSSLAGFTGALRDAGLRFGPPEPVRAPVGPLFPRVVAALGILAGVTWAGGIIVGWGRLWRFGLATAGAMALALPWLLSGEARVITSQGLALAGSVAFPVVALYPALARWVRIRPSKAAGNGPARVAAAAGQVVAAALTAASGGLMVLAAAGGPEFVLRMAEVPGIKLSLTAGPVLAVALLWLAAGRSAGTVQANLRGLADTFRRPLRLGLVLAVLAVLAAVVIYLSRSGNFPLIPVSDLEFEVRRRLAEAFGVRPRTKEFLFGYPALMLGAWLGYAALQGWRGPVLAALAGVGASSVLNTFSHAHIPALISLQRTGAGLALGLVVGAAAIAVIAAYRGIAYRRGRSGPGPSR